MIAQSFSDEYHGQFIFIHFKGLTNHEKLQAVRICDFDSVEFICDFSPSTISAIFNISTNSSDSGAGSLFIENVSFLSKKKIFESSFKNSDKTIEIV